MVSRFQLPSRWLIGLGVVLIIHTLGLALLVNFNTGIVATIVYGAGYVAYGYYRERMKGWLRRTLIVGNVALLLFVAFLTTVGVRDNVTYEEDALIVLGAGLKGATITLPLKYRLDAALDYAQRNRDALIVVSGGQGFGETVTEASAMAAYLEAHGLAPERIVKEERSTSTTENFRYSRKLLDMHPQIMPLDRLYTTAFVTNHFHVWRANQLARYADVPSTHLHAGLQWYMVPVSYVREVLAIGKMILLKE